MRAASSAIPGSRRGSAPLPQSVSVEDFKGPRRIPKIGGQQALPFRLVKGFQRKEGIGLLALPPNAMNA